MVELYRTHVNKDFIYRTLFLCKCLGSIILPELLVGRFILYELLGSGYCAEAGYLVALKYPV